MHYMSMSYIYNIYYLYNNPYQKKALWRTFRQVCRKLFSANFYNADEFAARLLQTFTMQMSLPQGCRKLLPCKWGLRQICRNLWVEDLLVAATLRQTSFAW